MSKKDRTFRSRERSFFTKYGEGISKQEEAVTRYICRQDREGIVLGRKILLCTEMNCLVPGSRKSNIIHQHSENIQRSQKRRQHVVFTECYQMRRRTTPVGQWEVIFLAKVKSRLKCLQKIGAPEGRGVKTRSERAVQGRMQTYFASICRYLYRINIW